MSPSASIELLTGIFLGAPLLYSAWRFTTRGGPTERTRWDWRLSEISTLAFTLAFNTVFFIQELFLVLPKAALPGVTPVLFHNDHGWRGDHPLIELFQGTGALATVLASIAFTVWLTRRPPRSDVARLTLFWLALLGFLAALPQVVIGAALPGNDVGRAMTYLRLPAGAKLAAAILACVAMTLLCRLLAPHLLSLAPVATPRSRATTMLRLGALPALAAIPLTVPFRVPNVALEILFPPTVDAVIAALWLQAMSWNVSRIPAPPQRRRSAAWLLAALVFFLGVFQLVLRRGIEF